jgi:putative tryptophan/tyrosine transport system substrate-binding protein
LHSRRELGYVEGQNLLLEDREAKGRIERPPDLAAELVRLQVDVILVRGASALVAVRQASRTILIVAVDLESDPVVMGFVASLARPGGNLTGVFLDLLELSGKQLELLQEVVPALSRVAVLGNPEINGPQFRALEVVARAWGVQLQALEVRGPEEFDRAFEAASRGGAAGRIVFSSPSVFEYRTRLADLAAKNGLPAISPFRACAKVGGLMAYGPSIPALYRRAAAYVDKILKGAKPSDLPVERPTKFELVINLKTAQALGLTIPPLLLFQADEVIQ